MKYRKSIPILILLIGGAAYYQSPDSPLYIVHTFLISALAYTLSKQLRSFFLLFISTLFIAGNWLKVSVHNIFLYKYVEATGSFNGSAQHWDEFFYFSISMSIALLTTVLVIDLAPKKKGFGRIKQLARTNSRMFFYISTILVIVIYLLNWRFGFYRIGVARELYLSFGLDAPASFLVYLGAPMLVAVLATNSVTKNRSVTIQSLIAIALVIILASTSTYSRASIVIVMLPIILGLYRKSKEITGQAQSITPVVFVMVPTLVLSLAFVSIARVFAYTDATTVDSDILIFYFFENLGLFIDRWIGAEGLMVAVSSNQSMDLFITMLFENPASGVNSIYQILSDSQYQHMLLVDKTFLTLPGAFALLAFSGNVLVSFIGVLLICILGVLVEQFVVQTYKSHYSLQYLISASLAYHFSQMIFPVLLIPFLIQVMFFLTLLKFFFSSTTKYLLRV